ncbi:hypothetical protein AB0B79_37430 [Streptomyces sp. NPDC039022]|uniref:hypothetical protein n=1 Tax=unclassified Streptomyces TaxID=2593676 RepID=UPI0033D77731
MLPTYVQRPHDAETRRRLTEIAAGERTELLVLRGGSCVGKTRTAFEAVRACLPTWQLIYPKTAAAVITACEEGALAARTVIWLDDAHQLLMEPWGEAAAAAVRQLLERPGPGVVIATVWPEHYKALTALPKTASDRDPHRQARAMLRSHPPVEVPTVFTEDAQAELRRAARTDRALRVALESVAQPGAVTQTLAAGPDLLDHWAQAAHPYGKAVITAAVDARRLGVRSALPAALLRNAAEAYLEPEERTKAPSDWFEQALEYSLEQIKDVTSALQPVARPEGMGAQIDVFDLADYLEEHGAAQRRGRVPAEAFWRSAFQHLQGGDDLDRLGTQAFSKGRYRWARQLHLGAAERGYAPAVESLCFTFTETGRVLTEEGRKELIEQARRADDGGYSLWYLGSLLTDIATEPDGPGDLLLIAAKLLTEALDAGYGDAVYHIAGIAEHLGLDASALVRDVEQKQAATARPAAHRSAEAALLEAAADADSQALATLTRVVQEQGLPFAALVRHAATDPFFPSPGLLLRLAKADNEGTVDALLQAVAATGARHAVSTWAGLLYQRDRDSEADDLLETAAEGGNDDALVMLCTQLWERTPEKAKALLRQAYQDHRMGAIVRAVRPLMSPGRRPQLRRFAEGMLRQLADDGDPRAQYELAYLLVQRWRDQSPGSASAAPTAADVPTEAIDLLEKAASVIPDACRLRGQAAVMRHDLPAAEHWYRKAVDAGDYQSLSDLAAVLYPASPEQQEQLVRTGLEPDGTPSAQW